MDKNKLSESNNLLILWYRQGEFKRIIGNEVSKVYHDLIENMPNAQMFFPDSCLKRLPPKIYFWKVFSVLKPQQYQDMMNSIYAKAKGAMDFPDGIILTAEALIIMNSLDNSRSLAYLSSLISEQKTSSHKSAQLHCKKFKEVL